MFHISFLYVVLPIIIVWIAYRAILFIKKRETTAIREWFINLFFIYFFMVAYFTFFKNGNLMIRLIGERYANLVPLVETLSMFKMEARNALYNVVGNVLLFVPLGFGVPLFFRNKNKLINVAGYGLLFSILIESLQYLTFSNITDIDDVIFNTFGAVVGFLMFNVAIRIVEKTRLKNITDNLSVNIEGSLILKALKPIVPMVLIAISIVLSHLYLETASGGLSDKEIGMKIFRYNSEESYVAITDIDKYKLFLTNQGKYLDLSSSQRVLGDRWMRGSGVGQLDITEGEFIYEVETLYREDDKKISPVIYGKNSHADRVDILFKGKEYSKKLPQNDFFIVTVDVFEKMNDPLEVIAEYSKDVEVVFREKDGSECKHIAGSK